MCHLSDKISLQDIRRNQLLVGHFYDKFVLVPSPPPTNTILILLECHCHIVHV